MLPVLLRDRPVSQRIVVAVVVPLVFGMVAGAGLLVAAGAYYALALIGMAGALLAGLEHDDAREAAARGVAAGAMFAVGVLLVDAIASGAPKADLPDPRGMLVPVSAIITALLVQPGAWRRRRTASAAKAVGE